MKIASLSRFILPLVCFFFLGNLQVKATHIVGGEIYYEHQGGSDYLITLKVYRDCGPDNVNGTGFDNQAHVGIFNGSSLMQVFDLDIFDATVNNVPVTLDNPCFILPPDLCIQEAVYQGVINLPPSVNGYDIVYQRCCRNNSILNILFPDDSGMSIFSHIPSTGVTNEENSAPIFTNFPPVALCQGAEFFFDHSATDADGDELVYEFYTPFLGGGTDGGSLPSDPNNPAPNPPLPPIYTELSWSAGYSESYQVASSPAITIDSNTGLITGTPNQLGRFAIGVAVHEYRNGVLINTTYRDFQYNVTICDPTIIASIPEQTQYCDGLTFDFNSNSVNATFFFWDFGDPNSDDDTSEEQNPSYTYSEPGTYEVMLVANPGWSCADTVFESYEALPLLTPTFINTDFSCINFQGFYSFETTQDNPATATYQWDFGTNATPQFSSDPSPSNITFSDGGEQSISLVVADLGCEEASEDVFEIPAPPVASIEPQVLFCDGMDVDFINNSTNAETYEWDFGVVQTSTDVSTDFEPSYTYSDTGHYNVTLIASSPTTCPSMATQEFIVYTLLDPYFDPPGVQCFTGNFFDVEFIGSATDQATYSWNITGASPSSSSLINPSPFFFTTPGTYPVSVTVTENNCVREYVDSAYVLIDPSIDFSIGEASGCVPLKVTFEDNSIAENTLYYLWDFGDGGQSTSPNPSYVYESAGTYDVTLTAYTTSGCVVSMTQTNSEAVVGHPAPYSNFYITPTEVNILEPNFEVNDLSEGAVGVNYIYEGNTISTAFEFLYSIPEPGEHFLTQELTSEYGCKSESTYGIVVLGHVIYVPTAFSPNGDGVNDYFRISSLGIEEFNMKIYNRWGEKIHETNDVDAVWLGEIDGGKYYYGKNEIYTYHITYLGQMETERKELIGTITILR